MIRHQWPRDLAVSGSLCLGTGLLLAAGGAWTRAAVVVVALDMLVVNGSINPLAPAEFYRLRPEVAGLVRSATRGDGPFRWFSYGLTDTPGLRFTRPLPSDVWLYYLDRQALLPRTNVLDGIESAFDVDRTGWAPDGATLAPSERQPSKFSAHLERLRHAGVRWVLSFDPLPDDVVALRGQARLDAVAQPLRLYELPGPLPRAFWTSQTGSGGPAAGGPAPRVSYERVGPHEIRLQASTPPGGLVVLEGFDPAWKAEIGGRAAPVARALERYLAVPRPGGDLDVVLRYSPRWRAPALSTMALGLAIAAALIAVPRVRRSRQPGRGGAGARPRLTVHAVLR